MARMFIDCRKYPSEKNCTVSIAADTRQELMEAAVQHAVAVHGHTDRQQLRPGDPAGKRSPPDIAARDVKPAACRRNASAGE